SPELLYCAESLIDAFPDARLVQIIRDGRDAVAATLSDPGALAWFRPGFVNLESELTHPLLGVETQAARGAWPGASHAGRAAMRWRGTGRAAARLGARLSSQQLVTLRYEEMIRQPQAAAAAVGSFIEAEVAAMDVRVGGTPMEPGAWRLLLAP